MSNNFLASHLKFNGYKALTTTTLQSQKFDFFLQNRQANNNSNMLLHSSYLGSDWVQSRDIYYIYHEIQTRTLTQHMTSDMI